MAQKALPLLCFEFLTELGLRVVARAEDLSDHLRVLAVHTSTLASLPLKNTKQCGRNISVKRALLVHWASPAAIVGVVRHKASGVLLLTDGFLLGLATGLFIVGASRLLNFQFDLVHVYCGCATVNVCNRDLRLHNLRSGVHEATVGANGARTGLNRLINDVCSRLLFVNSLPGVVAERTVFGCHALLGRGRPSATDLCKLARRDSLVRLAGAGAAVLRGADGGGRLGQGVARRVRDGVRLGVGRRVQGALSRAFALLRVALALLLLR